MAKSLITYNSWFYDMRFVGSPWTVIYDSIRWTKIVREQNMPERNAEFVQYIAIKYDGYSEIGYHKKKEIANTILRKKYPSYSMAVEKFQSNSGISVKVLLWDLKRKKHDSKGSLK